MKSLAIDFGNKRLGFAIGHRETGLASPLLTRSRTSLEDDLLLIRQLIQEHEVGELVIGRPLHMDGTPSALARQVEQFAAFLQKRIALPIHFVDERLSSREAENRLNELPGTFIRKKNALDAVAAVIILERFFRPESRS